ncbi:hypothetical protein [Methyloterricola oryzae]|uniref:hypothetical protein n=1 Tax=Methyloterricola oryzae TaxID=1495050 RepID=UPI0005EACC94|nr:hypothetical protein [Methyloterricola oryzae]
MPLIQLFIDICLFRRGPQDVPASQLLLGLAVLVYLTVGVVLLGLEGMSMEAVLQALVELLILLGFVWGNLKFLRLQKRFVQTAIAMLGADALISSLAIPPVAWMAYSAGARGAYLLLLLLMLWHLAVVAHILRHALSRPLGVGIGLAVVYVVASYQVMLTLFPPAA